MDTKEINPLIIDYLTHCKYEKGLDSKTLKAYKIDLSQFDSYIVGISGTYSKENVQTFIASLHTRYSAKTVKRKIATLKAFFSYLEFDERITINPFSKIRVKLQEPHILPRTIPLGTINTLLNYINCELQHAKEGTYHYRSILRDLAVLELLFATGMRISELCSLSVSDINLSDGTILIYGKGSRERLIQISNTDVLTALKNYSYAFSAEIENTGFFFVNRLGHQLSDQSVRFMIKKYCQNAEIKQHITPHMFRHSFATL